CGAGCVFPGGFKVEIDVEWVFVARMLVADDTGSDFSNPGDALYVAKVNHTKGRYIRVTATRLWREDPRTNDWIFALSELVAISDGNNVARDGVISASDSHNDSPAWNTKYLNDGSSSRAVLFDPSPTDGYQSETTTNANDQKWVQLDLGRPIVIDHVALMPARSRERPADSG